ncbi:MAG: hypothetical protein HRT46_08225 [Deltaproteobacteria bacterium]|nr:hypothetical protein [Deltaproteobacteria bacterium]
MDKSSQACVNAMNKGAVKVSSTQAKENSACIKQAARQEPAGTGAEACLVADQRGKIARAQAKTLAGETRSCDVTPSFAYSSGQLVNAAAARETIALIHDVYGQDLDAAVVGKDADRNGATCQLSASKGSAKLLAAVLREFVDTKKKGLRDEIFADAVSLQQACFDAINNDQRGKIARAEQKLASLLEKKCVARGVDLAAVLAGQCAGEASSGSSAAADCVETRVRCRACRLFNDADALEQDCDLFDNGSADNSCPACGNGVVEAGEECDDGVETATCYADCTATACADGTCGLGEDCGNCAADCGSCCGNGSCDSSLGEDYVSCPSECEAPGNCDVATPWQDIAPSLLGITDLLPSLPDTPLSVTWPDPLPTFLSDTLAPTDPPLGWVPDDSTCDVSVSWDADRVEAGPIKDYAGDPHCRVTLTDHPTNGNALFFANRWPGGSIHIPISGDPTWAQFRFPLPPAHRAVRLNYRIAWARLFGSQPDPCHADDTDELGNCIPKYKEAAEDWSENVPPGLFLLWGKAGNCQGYLVTGPHDPAAYVSYSAAETYSVEVPESLQTVDELVVAAFIYRQYPGGCDGANCLSGRFVYNSMAIQDITLDTEEIFNPPSLPALDHPRLFGANEQWLAGQEVFNNLPCYYAPSYEETAGWGSVTNIRNMWDVYTRGGKVCNGEDPVLIEDHPDAAPYLDLTAAGNWNEDRAIRVLHLVRRVRACHEQGGGGCQFSLADIDALVAQFIAVEIARFGDWTWENQGLVFDLGTLPPMRYWSIFADTLWDDLSQADHDTIATEMGSRIDVFLQHAENHHWALYNGNNWTPVLSLAAMYWAITYYHEDPRAPQVALTALGVLWLHRDFYLPDGAYKEGLMMYTHVSFDNLRQINMLSRATFGESIDSVRWDRMPAVSQWALEFLAPDGLTVDYGDSWAKRGWGTFMPLYMAMASELTGQGPATVDPCTARAYFNNRWFDWGLRNPFTIDASLARDWVALVEQCSAAALAGTYVTVFEDGGWGNIRVGLPGSTVTATLGDVEQRYEQADQTFLSVSAIPNTFPHTELDFGSLVWVAYGTRLLADLGYGSIDIGYGIPPDYAPDNNPTGHNTLVVPEALWDGDPSTNTSQVEDTPGVIESLNVSGIELLHLDGDAVYGRDDLDDGWLDTFDRWLLPLDGGHFVVADGFRVRADRPDSSVQEYWHTYDMLTPPAAVDCHYGSQHVEITLPDPGRLHLLPVCSSLDRYGAAESAGEIVGASLAAGGFVVDAPFEFLNRLGVTERRGRARWVPDQALRSDLRVFLLLAAPSEGALPAATITQDPCAADSCFQVSIGADTWELSFSGQDGVYDLLSVVQQ